MENQEESLGASYFGPIKPLEATGGYQPEPESIYEELEGPNSIIHLFCRGCGNVTELTQKGLDMCLSSENKPTPPTIEKGMYLASDGCIMCDGKDGNFEIRKI